MKKISFLFALVATLFSTSANAQMIKASDVQLVGNAAEVSFYLDGISETRTAVLAEFVITLPQGFSFGGTTDRRGNFTFTSTKGEIAADHDLTLFKRENGDIYVLFKNDNGYDFYPSNGLLLTLSLEKDETVAEGEYTASIHNVILADAEAKQINTETESEFAIEVLDATSINGITINPETQKVYTVGGQRVASKNLKKGIYVVDGKKVTVK